MTAAAKLDKGKLTPAILELTLLQADIIQSHALRHHDWEPPEEFSFLTRAELNYIASKGIRTVGDAYEIGWEELSKRTEAYASTERNWGWALSCFFDHFMNDLAAMPDEVRERLIAGITTP